MVMKKGTTAVQMPRQHPNQICIKSITYVDVFFRVFTQELGEHTRRLLRILERFFSTKPFNGMPFWDSWKINFGKLHAILR